MITKIEVINLKYVCDRITKCFSNIWSTLGDFLQVGGLGEFFEYGHIFTYTCPNGSGVGAIDRPDPFKHAFDPYCTLKVLKKFFMDQI